MEDIIYDANSPRMPDNAFRPDPLPSASGEGRPPVSLSEIARNINSVALDEDVLVFDTRFIDAHNTNIPTRIDALIIMLVKKGTARLTIDLRNYDLRPGSILVLQPKNYIAVIDHSTDLESQIIACSHRVVEDVLPKLTDILPLLMHHRATPVSFLTEEKAGELSQYYEFLRDQIARPKTVFQKKKVLCMLQAALFELMDIQNTDTEQQVFHKSRKEEIMAKFIILVGEDFRSERQVAYYARKLCITPKHLSSVVKQISGRTAGEWIENYVTMEAKVLLKTTDLTIQEIAAQLNFPNQSFFGKYFKHISGCSPTEFRKLNS